MTLDEAFSNAMSAALRGIYPQVATKAEKERDRLYEENAERRHQAVIAACERGAAANEAIAEQLKRLAVLLESRSP